MGKLPIKCCGKELLSFSSFSLICSVELHCRPKYPQQLEGKAKFLDESLKVQKWSNLLALDLLQYLLSVVKAFGRENEGEESGFTLMCSTRNRICLGHKVINVFSDWADILPLVLSSDATAVHNGPCSQCPPGPAQQHWNLSRYRNPGADPSSTGSFPHPRAHGQL